MPTKVEASGVVVQRLDQVKWKGKFVSSALWWSTGADAWHHGYEVGWWVV